MKRLISILLLFVLVLSGCTVGYRVEADVKFSSLDRGDQAMLKQMAAIYQVFETNKSDIWFSGYDFEKVPLIMIGVDKDHGKELNAAYGLNIQKLPDNWVKQKVLLPADMHLPEVTKIASSNVSELEGVQRGVNFGFQEIAGIKSMWFKYHPDNTHNSEFVKFLTHEAFHEYVQVTHWGNVDSLRTQLYSDNFTAEAYNLFLAELTLLDSIVEEEDTSTMERLLLDYVMIRSYRYEKYPDMKEETLIEPLEGTAEYVSNKVFHIITGQKMEGGVFKRVTDINSLKSGVEEYPYNVAEYMCKDVYYSTGYLMETLLDRLGIDWQRELQENQKTVWELLLAAFPVEINEQKAAEILITYGYLEYSDISSDLAKCLNDSKYFLGP